MPDILDPVIHWLALEAARDDENRSWQSSLDLPGKLDPHAGSARIFFHGC